MRMQTPNKLLAIKLLAMTGILCLFTAGPVWADADENKNSGVSRYGVTHNIAQDRKVEKVGGIYEPEGLDKYMKRKFDDLEAKINGLAEKIEGLTRSVKDIDTKAAQIQTPAKPEPEAKG